MNEKEIKPTWNYILNDIALSSLIIRNLYSESASIQDKKDLKYQIELIQQENQRLQQENKQLKKLVYKDNTGALIITLNKEMELQERIDKAIDYINEATNYPRGCGLEPLDEIYAENIIDRLKGE